MEKKYVLQGFSKQKLYNTIKGESAFNTSARNKNTNASGLFNSHNQHLTTSTKSLERTIHFKVLEV